MNYNHDDDRDDCDDGADDDRKKEDEEDRHDRHADDDDDDDDNADDEDEEEEEEEEEEGYFASSWGSWEFVNSFLRGDRSSLWNACLCEGKFKLLYPLSSIIPIVYSGLSKSCRLCGVGVPEKLQVLPADPCWLSLVVSVLNMMIDRMKAMMVMMV